MFRDRAPHVIMMIAALALVFHGAFSVAAHPLAPQAPESHELAQLAPHDHQLDHDDGGAMHDQHAHHDGKPDVKNDCCSTVSAITLPLPYGPVASLRLPARLQIPLMVAGEGLVPGTLPEPPSTTYQG
jgi:hypothetical protein